MEHSVNERGLSPSARITFIQNGDFRASVQRIEDGRGETYDAQKYSIEVVERLANQVSSVVVLCIAAEEPHDEVLPSGIRSIGLENIWKAKKPFARVIQNLNEIEPSHLVLRVPSSGILAWARRRKVRVLPSFADSFTPRAGFRGWLDRWRHHRLGKYIDHHSIDYVGNHNIAAAEALATLGVSPKKIVPWDWPRSPTPADFPAKPEPAVGSKKLIYVGTVSEAKGVGDVIRALAADPTMGEGARLEVVGTGDIDGMRLLSERLGVADRVSFVGRVPHAEVAPRMHAADAVVVYSRHTYGEGLPGTIYLGLASRTPLILSNHPMFTAYINDGEEALIAPEREPEALAARIRDLFGNADLYTRLSRGSGATFERITHPVLWGEFVERWLQNTYDDRAWLEAQTLPRWRSVNSGVF